MDNEYVTKKMGGRKVADKKETWEEENKKGEK